MLEVLNRPVGVQGFRWPVWALGLIALYFFWPMDLISDTLPLIGVADDLFVAGTVAALSRRR